MIEIEPYRPADLPVIEAFIAGLYDAERELDGRLSPGVELAAGGLKRMLSDVSEHNGLVLMARADGALSASAASSSTTTAMRRMWRPFAAGPMCPISTSPANGAAKVSAAGCWR